MDSDTLRKLHGTAQLITEAVDAALGGVEKVQQSITRNVYAPLTQAGPIAPPARVAEQMQAGITTSVYQLARMINRMAGTTAAMVLENVERATKTGR